ncbi:MAG: hypothetical protein ACREFW_10045 [Rhizomicrobium sp.]
MTRLWLRPFLPFVAAALLSSPAQADQCFVASKIYHVYPVHGGRSIRDGWQVVGNVFAQCVRRAEAADKRLRARYPGSAFELSLAATIGCHGAPCD